MKTIASALLAAAVLALFGSVAADATPFPPTAFVPVAGPAVSFSDTMFIFKPPGPAVLEGLAVTPADISACSNIIAGGCLFDVPNPLGLPFDAAQEGRFTLVYEPDGVTLSDLFGMRCNGVSCNLAFLSEIPGQPIDLTGVDISNFYAVTELAGVPSTVFDATYYLDPTWLAANRGTFARFISANDVPEPATLTLFGAGIVGAAAIRRRRKRG
jgi:hypothetical protein